MILLVSTIATSKFVTVTYHDQAKILGVNPIPKPGAGQFLTCITT